MKSETTYFTGTTSIALNVYVSLGVVYNDWVVRGSTYRSFDGEIGAAHAASSGETRTSPGRRTGVHCGSAKYFQM